MHPNTHSVPQIREVATSLQLTEGVHRDELKLGLSDSLTDAVQNQPEGDQQRAPIIGADFAQGIGSDASLKGREMVMRSWALVEGSSGRSALMVASVRDIQVGSQIQLHRMRYVVWPLQRVLCFQVLL